MNSRINKTLKIILAFTLVTTIVFQSAGVCAYAVGDKDTIQPTETTELPVETEHKITHEEESRREEFAKHFNCEDGTYTAVVYAEPVHFMNSENKWIEYDNSLILNQDGSSYSPKTSDIDVVFPKTLNDKGVSISKSGFPFEMRINSENAEILSSSTAVVDNAFGINKNNDIERSETELHNREMMNLDNKVSEIKYCDIMDNVDLEYILSSSRVKENIIINRNNNVYSYDFEIDYGELIPKTFKNGSIGFFVSDDEEEPVYQIEKPYMYDRNGEISNDVSMKLTDNKLTLTVNSEWINDNNRVFPITIDPSVSVGSGSMIDSYVSHTIKNTNYGNNDYTYAGKHLVLRRAYIKFPLPSLPDNAVITGAKLKLTQKDCDGSFSSDCRNVLLFNLSGKPTWTETGITWNNQPLSTEKNGPQSVSSLIASQLQGNILNNHVYYFDITPTVRTWYKNNSNNGLMISTSNEEKNPQVSFYSTENSSTSDRPYVSINYTVNTGVEDYLNFQTVNMGEAGATYINSQSGALIYARNDAATNGLLLPINVSHIYLNNNDDFASGTYGSMKFGKGFRLNLLEKTDGYNYYTDADGTKHDIKYDYNTYKYYLDGDSTTVFASVTGGKTMTYADGTVKLFNSSGYLTSVTDKNGNQININYSSDRITSVSDGAGYSIIFGYNANNYLTSITDPAGRVTSFTYDSSGYLTQITNPDSTTTTFTYSSSNLTQVMNSAGKRWKYDYVNTSYDTNGYSYVSAITEYGDGNTSSYLDKINFTYNGNTSEISNNHGDSVILEFDELGRVVGSNSKGNASKIQYCTSTGNTKNKVEFSSSQFSVTENLISKYYQNLTNWYYSGSSGSMSCSTSTDRIDYYSTSHKYSGTNSSLELSPIMSINVSPGKTYTFSANVNIEGKLSHGKIYVELESGNVVECSPEYITTSDKWRMISCSITIPAGSTTVKPKIVMETITGSIYIDAVQLTEGNSIKMYNLVPDPCFNSYDIDGWTGSNGSSIGAGDATIYGFLLEDREVEQTFTAGGKANEEFIFGVRSWSKAMDLGEGSFYGVKIVFISSGSTVCTRNYSFDTKYYNQWQQMLAPISSTADFDSIRIELHYDTQVNSAIFKDVFIYKSCNYGVEYTYNSNGNVIREADGAGNSVDLTYSNADITKAVKKTGNTTEADVTYTYDNNHNVLTATDSVSGTVTTYTYPSSGNKGQPLSVTVSDIAGTQSSTTSYSYTPDYNYLTGVTDPSGAAVSYTYNTSKGLLTSSTDANGNVTNYSYNAANDLLTSISNPDTSLGNAHTDYTYDASKRLTGISNNDISYGMTYDIYGRTDTVKNTATNTLSDTTYNSDSTVSRVDYADGGYAEYTYDDKDRVTSSSYNGARKYEYKYTDNDSIYEVYDVDNQVITKYQYDSFGRVSGMHLSNGNGVLYSYNAENNPDNFTVISEGDIINSQNFSYDNIGKVTEVEYESIINSPSVTYSYDSLNRVTSVTNNYSGSNSVSRNYTYRTNGNNQTGYVSGISYSGISTPALTYTYDGNGNITHIYENNVLKAEYFYDGLNRLIRENNRYYFTTVVYDYDSAGDILSKTEYEYCTQEDLSSAILRNTKSYSYTDSRWKNGVTSYNGESIVYDANGNPTTYRGYTMTWDKGCQLASANKSGITTSYKYDYNGIRTEKTVDGVKTEYFYVGSTLMSQKSGNNVMNFYYNADGSPYGFTLNGTPYYYILNLQGDVIGIYNGNGTVIVSYVYNSWGKLLSITGTGYYIGLNNPLRYRGYVYDTETELYYLQSRYYDPETGRFISADSLLVAGDSINGTNMFAYCCNNPVCYCDPSGRKYEGVDFVVKELVPALMSLAAFEFLDFYWIEPVEAAFLDGNFTAVIDIANQVSEAIKFLGGDLTNGDSIKYYLNEATQICIAIGNEINKNGIEIMSYLNSVNISTLFNQYGDTLWKKYKDLNYNLFETSINLIELLSSIATANVYGIVIGTIGFIHSDENYIQIVEDISLWKKIVDLSFQ